MEIVELTYTFEHYCPITSTIRWAGYIWLEWKKVVKDSPYFLISVTII